MVNSNNPSRSTAVRIIVLSTLLLSFQLAFGHITAERVFSQNDDSSVNEEAAPATKQGAIDATHQKVSQSILSSSEWLDRFFDSELYIEEDNQTRVRIKTSSFIESGEGIDNSIKFSLRLTLPRLQKKLQLFFFR